MRPKCCDSWEHFPLELRRHSVDSIHILEVVVPFSHTEHKVGEDVGFGAGELISFTAHN